MGLLTFLGIKRDIQQYLPCYTQIVSQARNPALYIDGAAPDTLDGRFDMMVIHMHLVLRSLRRAGEGRSAASQALFDLFFKDMDQGLREAGVGDLSVGKKVKKMAEAFYGRAAAYDQVLGKPTDPVQRISDERVGDLANVLARNLYPDDDEMRAETQPLSKLSRYILFLEHELAVRDTADIIGEAPFVTQPELDG